MFPVGYFVPSVLSARFFLALILIRMELISQ